MSNWDDITISWNEYILYKDENNPYDNTYCCSECNECDIFEDDKEYHVCSPEPDNSINNEMNTT